MRLYDFRHKTTNLFEREVIIFQRFCRWNVVIDFTSKVGFCKAAYCEKYLSGAERGIHSHSINKIMLPMIVLNIFQCNLTSLARLFTGNVTKPVIVKWNDSLSVNYRLLKWQNYSYWVSNVWMLSCTNDVKNLIFLCKC